MKTRPLAGSNERSSCLSFEVFDRAKGMFRLDVALLMAVFSLVWVTGCKPPNAKPTPGGIVAVVGTNVITEQALEAELARRALRRPTEIQKTEVLEDLIRFEVLFTSAQRAGFEQRPEVQNAIKELVVARYRTSLEQSSSSNKPPTEIEIANYYHQHPERFGTPEQIRIAMIFIPISGKALPELRVKALQKAEAIRIQAARETGGIPTFGLLAQTNSAHQSSRYRGGDLGWMTRAACEREWGAQVTAAIFQLTESNALSPVIEGKEGCYLFKLIARKAATLRPLAEVRDGIIYQLDRAGAEAARQLIYQELRAQAGVRIHSEVLARVGTNIPPERSPPMPGR